MNDLCAILLRVRFHCNGCANRAGVWSGFITQQGYARRVSLAGRPATVRGLERRMGVFRVPGECEEAECVPTD